MKFLNVGKIVNTFGIKGELKIVSHFEMSEKVFKVGNKLKINNNIYTITNVRFHKNNYLIELNNLKDINDIEYLKGNDVYFNEEDLNLGSNEYLLSSLVGYEVLNENIPIGTITDYDDNKINPLIKVNDKFYIPVKGKFIERVDILNKKVYAHNLEELIL